LRIAVQKAISGTTRRLPSGNGRFLFLDRLPKAVQNSAIAAAAS
jgi:hypothetical protein